MWGGGIEFPLAKLTAFLEDGARKQRRPHFAGGLPLETLQPIFPLANEGIRNWFGPGPAETEWKFWRDALLGELQNQFPKRIMLRISGMASVNPDLGTGRFGADEKSGGFRRSQPDALVKDRQDAGAGGASLPEHGGISPGQAACRNWRGLRPEKRFLKNGVGPVANTQISRMDSVGNSAPTVQGGEPADLRVNFRRSPAMSNFRGGVLYHSQTIYGEIAMAAAADLASTASLTLTRSIRKIFRHEAGQME